MVGAERKVIQLNQPTFKLFNELFLFSRKTIFQALSYFARFYYKFKNKETVIIAVYKSRNDTKTCVTCCYQEENKISTSGPLINALC